MLVSAERLSYHYLENKKEEDKYYRKEEKKEKIERVRERRESGQ